VVSKQSKNPAAAWNFLKFISSKDSLDKYYVVHNQPSSRKDLITLQISDPQIGVFANANLTAKSFYRPDQARMDDIFGKMIDNVILNGMASQDALSQAEQQVSTIVQNAQ
jgi:ABC-type glycerol-3-phosphate transport system substrate-binding protein